jgi:pyruvate formate lyase activating enzyme
MHQAGIWLEITTLIVPNQNDSKKELKQIAQFIARIDKSIPWHISRFHPDYHLTEAQPTPIKTLEMAYEIGKEQGLKFVYLGNIITEDKENTYCPKCQNLAIKRKGYKIEILGVNQKGECTQCHEDLRIRM